MSKVSKKVITRTDEKGTTIFYGIDGICNSFKYQGISACCNGRLTKYKGYTWKYITASILRTCTGCNVLITNENKINSSSTYDNKGYRCTACNKEVGNNWNRDNYSEYYPKIKDKKNNQRKEALELLKVDTEKYNKYLENMRSYQKEYRQTDTSKITRAAYQRKRYANKTGACPKWLSCFDNEYIKHIYKQCRMITKLTDIQHHVDHIVPLRGKTVSGLHVPWNLQIITAESNIKKGNKWETEWEY